jgi:hypothetical protein
MEGGGEGEKGRGGNGHWTGRERTNKINQRVAPVGVLKEEGEKEGKMASR